MNPDVASIAASRLARDIARAQEELRRGDELEAAAILRRALELYDGDPEAAPAAEPRRHRCGGFN